MNSFFLRPKINWLFRLFLSFILVTSTGCALIKRKPPGKEGQPAKVEEPKQKDNSDVEVPSPIDQEVVKVEVPKPPPKLGVILGAGGLRAFAHIGVLSEFEKAGVPIHSIVGLEWGALVAAIYAQRASANDLEWQLFKLSEDDLYESGILGRKKSLLPASHISPYLQKVFADHKIDDFRIPFSCPTRSTVNNLMFWQTRGVAQKKLMECLAFPPFFMAEGVHRAAVNSLPEAVEHLKKNGAEAIVFVDVAYAGDLLPDQLPEHRFYDNIIWPWLRQSYKEGHKLADDVVAIYIDKMTIDQFSARKEAVLSGQRAGRAAAVKLLEKYKF